jgi:zinc transport system permease protein
VLFRSSFAFLLFVLFFCFFHPILYTAFDRELAKTKGVKTALIEHVMMLAIAVTIVSSIRLIGIMLLMSLLTVPQMTANLFTSQFKNIIFFSFLIGITGCFSGLFISFYLNVPSGATIIFVQVLLFFASKLVLFLRQKTIKQA